MNKIGVLNFQYSHNNYGAVLQAAALQHILEAKGALVKHIDYRPDLAINLKNCVKKLFNLFGYKKYADLNNSEAFEVFRKEFLVRTSVVTSRSGFFNLSKNFDVVVVGSDQVWRPDYVQDPLMFFLKFMPEDVHRVAYAASFGVDEWKGYGVGFDKKVSEAINNFKNISCREDSGVSICEKVFGRSSTHVLDPLLLVDDDFFKRIFFEKSSSENNVLSYYKLDDSISFQMGLKSVSNYFGGNPVNMYLDSGGKKYRSVREWVDLINNSEYILTDSFHCICLALRFGKKVIYNPNPNRGAARMESLFRVFDLKIIPLDLKRDSEFFIIERGVDFSDLLRRERLISNEFIDNSIFS